MHLAEVKALDSLLCCKALFTVLVNSLLFPPPLNWEVVTRDLLALEALLHLVWIVVSWEAFLIMKLDLNEWDYCYLYDDDDILPQEDRTSDIALYCFFVGDKDVMVLMGDLGLF